MDPEHRLEHRLLASERRLARPCAPQQTVHRAERALLRRSLRRVRTLQQALKNAVARKASKTELATIERDLRDAQTVVEAILDGTHPGVTVARARGRPRERRSHQARRASAAATADPSEPAPAVALAPKSRAILTFAWLTAEQRGQAQ